MSYVDSRQPAKESTTSYLNVNRYGTADDNNSSRSSRSASPASEYTTNAASEAPKNSLLLDFEGSSSSSDQEAAASKVPTNDFQLLLDLDDEPQETNTKPTEPKSDIFNGDFFSSSSSNNNAAPKTNDLDDLFGSISQPSAKPTPSAPSNNLFDPFESLMQATPSTKNNSFNDFNAFNTSNNMGASGLNKPLNATKNNSSSNLLHNKGNLMGNQTNSARLTPTDPFADLTAFSKCICFDKNILLNLFK